MPGDQPDGEDRGTNLALVGNLRMREGGGDLECQRCGASIPWVEPGKVRYYWLTLFGPPAGVTLTICPSCSEKLKILSSAVYAMLSDGERKVSVTFTGVGQGKMKPRKLRK